MKRRSFLKESAIAGGLSIPGFAFGELQNAKREGVQLRVSNPLNGNYFEPLEEIHFSAQSTKGKFTVVDGGGDVYHSGQFSGELNIRAGGRLGNHQIVIQDTKGSVIDQAAFFVSTSTKVEDETQEFKKILDTMYWTMRKDQGDAHRFRGKVYYTFMGWFQDHVHVMKGMKYFYPEIKSGIDLFADGQAANGMIYDNYNEGRNRLPAWSSRFNYENFCFDPGGDSSSFFNRIPIENMGEFTFLEGLYFTWKATGDNKWMSGRIDNALKAIEYGTTNPWRWSEKFRLLKRAYTIDIWDFLPDDEAARFKGDVMAGDLQKTNFGVLYADNIGMAVGCEYVAEMLEFLSRNKEAEAIKRKGDELRRRTDDLCWNGNFYTHRIPENPQEKLDFGGTEENKQVTLSNSYVLNKRISHDKAVSIIKTYQTIREEMPETSPGEWYMCYPPYNKGWHMDKWEYMNGGVSGIVAGELAHGAFEHGYEKYAADILRRIYKLAQTTNNYLKCIYRGAGPDIPKRELIPYNLKSIANADFSGEHVNGVPGWMGNPDNAIPEFPTGKQTFEDIPFDIVDPASNGRRSCIGLSAARDYKKEVSLSLGRKIGSIYLLHNISDGNYAGKIVWQYDDNTASTYYVLPQQDLGKFTFPESETKKGWPVENRYIYKVAWKGKNKRGQQIGVYICGIDNPNPGKPVKSIKLVGPENNSRWMISGITISDKPHFFMPPHTSFGAPDSWAAAAVTYALIEGLAGVKDTGVAFDKALISPRWSSAGVNKASAHIMYEASGGYVAYRYNKEGSKIFFDFTGSAKESSVEILLSEGEDAREVKLNGEIISFEIRKVEQSVYAVLKVAKTGVYRIEVFLK